MLAIGTPSLTAMVVFGRTGTSSRSRSSGVVGEVVSSRRGWGPGTPRSCEDLALDYWHHGGGGQTPDHDWHKHTMIAAVVEPAAAPVPLTSRQEHRGRRNSSARVRGDRLVRRLVFVASGARVGGRMNTTVNSSSMPPGH